MFVPVSRCGSEKHACWQQPFCFCFAYILCSISVAAVPWQVTTRLAASNHISLWPHSSKGQKYWWAWLDSLLRVSCTWGQGVSWAGILPAGSGGDSAAHLMQVIDRIHFHVRAGLRSLVPCWLSPRAHCQLLEATYMRWVMPPSSAKPAMPYQILLELWISLMSSSVSALKDLGDCMNLPGYYLDNLPILVRVNSLVIIIISF